MTVRSDLVFAVNAQVPNRYLLCRLAAHATRKLHKPNNRIQDTVNDVLTLFRKANPMAEGGASPKPRGDRAAARPARVLRSVEPPIEHMDMTRLAVGHAGLSPERIGA